jgi:hypothetical protein
MDTLKKYQIYIKGISPLIMHSDKLVDPLNPMKKKLSEITQIKKKKDEHYLAMAKIEWEAALYYSEELGIHMPSKCLKGCIKSAAKKYRLGTATKGILIDEPIGAKLIGYEKYTPEKLWEKVNDQGKQIHVFSESLRVGTAKIMRTRPIFPKWEVRFGIFVDLDIFSYKDLEMVLNTAGYEAGLCELRPEKAAGTYGRFNVEEIKEV